MIRTYKRKLKLTKVQEQRLRSWIGACRTVYNLGLEVKIAAYKTNKSSIGKYDLMKQLTGLREDVSWIADVPIGSLQNEIEKLNLSYLKFFKECNSGGGFPKFATKKSNKSIAFKHTIRVDNDKIILPKIGALKLFKDKRIVDAVKLIRIKIEPTGFFAYVVCEVPDKIAENDSQIIGLDMGLAKLCTLSNGEFIANPKHFKKNEAKLRIENRSLSRKVKYSKSWYRQVKRLGLLQHKIANVRKDFLHKESTKIANAYGLVCVEKLNITGMIKNGKLSKHISDAGWGMFKDMLGYKTRIIAIAPAYTSQTCFECGNVDKCNRLSQSSFKCTLCGHIDNADVNAAKNIERQGMALDRERKAVA